MAAIYDMGKESGLWDTMLRTDTELLTKKELKNNAKNLNYFDAVIFASRLDMTPDGMQEMATKLTPISGAEPGTYRFKANVSMAGHWQLSLGAKLQGETGTLENKLVIQADKSVTYEQLLHLTLLARSPGIGITNILLATLPTATDASATQ